MDVSSTKISKALWENLFATWNLQYSVLYILLFVNYVPYTFFISVNECTLMYIWVYMSIYVLFGSENQCLNIYQLASSYLMEPGIATTQRNYGTIWVVNGG